MTRILRPVPRLSGHSVVHNSAWIMVATVVTSLLGAAYWLVASRVFSQPTIGIATALVSLMTVTALIATMGTASGLVQHLPRHRGTDEWSRIMSASLVGATLLGLLGAMVVLIALPLISPDLAATRRDPAIDVLFVAGVAVTSIASVLDYTYIAERSSNRMAQRGMLFGLAKLPLVALPAIAAGLSRAVTTLYASWVVGAGISAVGGFVLLRQIRPDMRLALANTGREFRRLQRSHGLNHAVTLGNVLPTYVLPIVVVNQLSPSDNAYFYIAWMIGGVFFMISSSVGSALFAEGRYHRGSMRPEIRRAVSFTSVLLFPTMLVVAVLASDLLGLFGEQYADHATMLLLILTVSAVPDAITNIYVAILRARDRVGTAATLTTSMALLATVGAWYLVGPLGLEGVGVAWGGSQVAGSLFVLADVSWARRRRTSLKIERGVTPTPM